MSGRFWLLFRSTNQRHQIQLATYCVPYMRLLKTSDHYKFTLNMATEMLAETLDNFEHSRRPSRKPNLYST
jgi:hypothetical protein